MIDRRIVVILICIGGLLAGVERMRADKPGKKPPARGVSMNDSAGVIGARALDLDGGVHRLGMSDPLRHVALIFIDPACPISNRYAPELDELRAQAARRNVDLFGVLSDPAVSVTAARAFRTKYGLKLPILFDASGDLAIRLRPTTVPEAFLIDTRDRVVYRGRIDNRFAAVGRLRQKITRRDLLDAFGRVASGKPTAPVRTVPIGCIFEAWKPAGRTGKVTYTRNIAPILDANCVSCHRDGGIAPFALQTYEQSQRRAGMLAFVTKKRRMPPWSADPGHGSFRDERRLSKHQIGLLDRWSKAGAPRGQAADRLPAPKVFASGWPLGKPDLELKMRQSFEVPAKGADIYRYFVIPSGMTQDRVITAMDFRPGDATVVHHSIFYMDYSGRARRLDARDPRPGFRVFGTENFMATEGVEGIGGWAPGADPFKLPAGLGMRIPGGGDIVLEIHYHLTGKQTTDRSTLALYFAKKPVKRYVEGLVLRTEDLSIPAGERNYVRRISMDVPAAFDLINISPHMHYLAREVHVELILPSGKKRSLIKISDWDFRWQNVYTYRQPIRVPKGSRLVAHYRFDNSDTNPANPSDPPRRVGFGPQTTDEMCELYLTIVPVRAADQPKLLRASLLSMLRSADPSLPLGLRLDAKSAFDRLLRARIWEPVGEQLLEQIAASDKLDQVLARFRAIEKPTARQATVHGMLLALASVFESSTRKQLQLGLAADQAINRALAQSPEHWDALLAKAVLQAYSEDSQAEADAIARFERLIVRQRQGARQAGHARTYFYYGELLEKRGKRKQARSVWAEGLKVHPTDRKLRAKIN